MQLNEWRLINALMMCCVNKTCAVAGGYTEFSAVTVFTAQQEHQNPMYQLILALELILLLSVGRSTSGQSAMVA